MRWRLLTGVPDEEVRRLLSVARRRRFARHEVVFHREDPADSLHLIVKGRFALRIMTRLGETITIGVRGPGDSFGEMALVGDGAPRSATVAALEEAESFAVYVDDFQRLRREHPAVDQVLIGFLAGEVRRQNELLLEALYVPAERRLLRRLAELNETYADAGGVIQLTQEELAELAGTSRATVNRVLREEQRRGTIELRRGRTIVVDADELARRAR
ncbi:MAG: family transcriptional regulator, cyclic receptor protein [Gaiellaceae bacterium]|jgi:CRP-like cAMP-binding protein|nr:family transcriptional regulator, cyclic receptor protein [Gaiellaceae bacterium]